MIKDFRAFFVCRYMLLSGEWGFEYLIARHSASFNWVVQAAVVLRVVVECGECGTWQFGMVAKMKGSGEYVREC